MQFTRVVMAALGALTVALMSAVPASAHESRPAATGWLIPSAGWHGRPIKNPHHHNSVRTAAVTPLSGWSAGPVSFGTGYRRLGGSDRVREVQRRLTRLGYHTGPIDGLFGPLTRASVGWFQVKHGLPVNGRATLATVRHLRSASGGARGESTQRVTTRPRKRPVEPAGSPRAERASTPLDSGSAAEGEGSAPAWIAGSALALMALVLVLATTVVRRRDGHKPEPSATAQPHARALAYSLIPAGESDEERLRSHAEAIETECAARGLAVVGMVVDVEDSRLIWQRPGLATAVRRLVDGEVDFLMLAKVDDASGADLKRLVEATEGEIAIARWQRESRVESRHERELSNA